MTDQEINEAVARKLGYNCKCQCHPGPSYSCECFMFRCKSQKPNDYCRSIAAAWEVVEFVGKHSSWSMYWLGGPDDKKFWRVAVLGSEYVDSDTAAMAICRAFLEVP